MLEDFLKDNKENIKDYNEDIKFPDLSELWKEIYFKNEEAMANAAKEVITTQTFTQMLNQMREQYLLHEKVTKQNLDKIIEKYPLPSKKDIARIAELIIALEDKVDNFDHLFVGNINAIANSMLKFVNFQEKFNNEISSLREDLSLLNTRLDNLDEKMELILITLNNSKKSGI